MTCIFLLGKCNRHRFGKRFSKTFHLLENYLTKKLEIFNKLLRFVRELNIRKRGLNLEPGSRPRSGIMSVALEHGSGFGFVLTSRSLTFSRISPIRPKRLLIGLTLSTGSRTRIVRYGVYSRFPSASAWHVFRLTMPV